ncbi:glycosyltransferase [Candidatus Margulisiibacteriota bacterium]
MFDFVCFSINNWEKRRARKQQFMLHLAKRNDVGRILYIEPPQNIFRLIFFPLAELKNSEFRKRWRRALTFKLELIADKLYLFTPVFFIPFSFRLQFIYNINLFIASLIVKVKIRQLGLKNIIIWLYHPFDRPLLKWFKKIKMSVFDWAEAWSEYFNEYSESKRDKIRSLEEKIVQDVNIVLVVSQRLLHEALKLNKQSYQVLDGTVPEIFNHSNKKIPSEIKDLPHPILAYVGGVYNRVDLDLIADLSEALDYCTIVLLGKIYFPPEILMKITCKKNVLLLGVKDYNELPDYMANFDVFILPYITELVTSPATKIYDYLAVGKPIVSTNLVELDKFKGYIEVAQTNEEFIQLVKKSLNENSLALQQKRRAMARQNSWTLRAGEIMAIIGKKA